MMIYILAALSIFAVSCIVRYLIYVRDCKAFLDGVAPRTKSQVSLSREVNLGEGGRVHDLQKAFKLLTHENRMSFRTSQDGSRIFCSSHVMSDLPVSIYVDIVGRSVAKIEYVDQFRQPIMIFWMRKRYRRKIDQLCKRVDELLAKGDGVR